MASLNTTLIDGLWVDGIMNRMTCKTSSLLGTEIKFPLKLRGSRKIRIGFRSSVPLCIKTFSNLISDRLRFFAT